MTRHTWPDVLSTLVAGQDLSADAAAWAMAEVLAGNATPVQVAGFAVALRAKGETVAEIGGLADAMLDAGTPLPVEGRVLDIVGTGGDRSMSVNISTMSAIVAAGAGARVVKHGNRSASSKSGSADVLEELGIQLDLPARRVRELVDEAGPRRELGIATSFNLLGPLTNPARPAAQAIGCADPRTAPIMAGVFAGRGVDAWVFRGDDGLDELTIATTSTVWTVHEGRIEEQVVDPTDLGLPRGRVEDLRGGDPAFNADVARRLLAGETGPVRDAVLLNAGAALAVYDGGEGTLQERLAAGIARAAEAIDSGAAAAALERWVAASSR